MPVEDGLDRLAKEILASGRTYSVFDLTKLVLGARDRFNVNFRTKAEGGIIRCKKDGSLWLTKEEAIRHFWHSEWRKDYYEEAVSSAKPPQGNFQTVARCGISGEWLGPPNYHGYQPALMQLHRERFGNMALETYKRKVRMERGEEAVAAWLDKMSKRIAYRPTGGVRPGEAEPANEESSKGEAEEPEVATEAPVVEETPVDEGAAVPEESAEECESATEDATIESPGEAEFKADEAMSETEGEEAPAAASEELAPTESDEPLLAEKRDVERHFVENYFEEAFQSTNRAWVGGNIPGNHLSPGLLTLLRLTVAEERRYPGKLTPMLCRQLSGRHVAVFKWRRKLKAGPSRPHPVPEEIVIADRPRSLLNWITENSGKKLEPLWGALLPKEVSDDEKREWYHDLHWLLNQGYVLLMADSSVHRAKKPGEEANSPPAKKGKTKKTRRGQAEARSKKPAGGAPQEKSAAGGALDSAPRTEEAEPVIASVTIGGTSGLYALGGRTLSGEPKSIEALTGRGLWPSRHRLQGEDEDEGEGDESDSSDGVLVDS